MKNIIGIKYEFSGKICFTWEELKKEIESSKNIELYPYYKDYFNLARLFSLNHKFISHLKRIRKKYYFDQFDPKDLEKKLTFCIFISLKKSNQKIYKFCKGINNLVKKALEEITSEFQIKPKWYSLIENLIVFNYFAPCHVSITDIDSFAECYIDKEMLCIKVFHPISKNYLYKLIDNIWKESKKEILNLPKLIEAPVITDRDARIVELRDERKMKYSEIADQIVKEFQIDNEDAIINEDSVKTAYKRAKEKINSINK